MRQMEPHSTDVPDVAAAQAQICFVAIERLPDRDRPIAFTVRILRAAGKDSGLVLSLPEGKNGRAIRFFEIIRGSETLHPVAATAVGGDHAPGTSGRIAPVP